MAFKLTKQNFRGPWTGLPVAWDDQFRFDEATYRKDIASCCAAGVPGIYTGGTTGEFYAMEFDEFKAIMTASVKECQAHKMPVMIGCSSTYTLGAMRRAAFAAELGADAIQVALPFWMAVGDSELVAYYSAVASAAPGLALSIYDTGRSKKVLTLDQHRRIKEAVPSYLMVKANDGVGATVDGCKELSKYVNVFVGEDRWSDLGRVGASGGCASLTYWFPKYVLNLWKQVEASNWSEVDRRCAALNELFKYLGVGFKGRGFTDSAFDRLGGALCGVLAGGLRCRAPYPHATQADVEHLRQWCREHHPELLET